MSLFSRRPRPGTVWDGPAAICDDASVDHRHGAYALTDDGKHVRWPLVRLVTVVSANGEHHYEVSGKNDPPIRHLEGFQPQAGDTVEFEPEPLHGRTGVGT